jgi:hypothetical protein
VRVPAALARLRTALRSGWHDPVTHYGAKYEGRLNPKGNLLEGVVRHYLSVSERPPSAVIALRDGREIGRTCLFEQDHGFWRFTISVDREVIADDILSDRLAVVAVDRLGAPSKLQLDAGAHLSFVRERFGAPAELELTVDFSRAGNSAQFVREGWYGPEQEHTWTAGNFSTIELPLRVPGSEYELEILTWPFVVPDKILSQELTILVRGERIVRFFVRGGQNCLETLVPGWLADSGSILVLFQHPDAARPCDFDPGTGDRMLALAFRQIKLRRRI